MRCDFHDDLDQESDCAHDGTPEEDVSEYNGWELWRYNEDGSRALKKTGEYGEDRFHDVGKDGRYCTTCIPPHLTRRQRMRKLALL